MGDLTQELIAALEKQSSQPRITVDGLVLLGNYWFQLMEGGEASVQLFPPKPHRIIFKLKRGDQSVAVLPQRKTEHDLEIEFTGSWERPTPGSASLRPSRIGHLGRLEVWLSFALEPIINRMEGAKNSMLINVALYVKLREKKEEDVANKK